MLSHGLDSQDNNSNWNRLYNRLPGELKVAYFSPVYYAAYFRVECDPCFCFWAENESGEFLFYPYLKRSINSLGYCLDDQYFDVCGAYGYNGPIGKADSATFIREFNEQLQHELACQNVVTEFVRYCPIPENRQYHTYLEQINVLDNVYVDIGIGIDRLWSESYEKNLRTSIRKGASYGLYSKFCHGIEITLPLLQEAYSIYVSTMQRNNADDFYYFGMEFVERLYLEMPEKLFLIITYHEDTAISFELLIGDGILAYALLGGTLSEFYRLNPNTFQKNELFIGLIQCGFKIYSMGGGVSRFDNLFAYKKGFNKRCENPFYIGTKVHNPDVYGQIVTQWQAKYPDSYAKYSGRIQGYRMIDLPQS